MLSTNFFEFIRVFIFPLRTTAPTHLYHSLEGTFADPKTFGSKIGDAIAFRAGVMMYFKSSLIIFSHV